MNNNMKRKKSGIVISVILFLFSAVSLIYGIYMVRYSLSYVNTYTGMSAVPVDKVMQYVVSASSIYFGFGILFAACAIIILFLSGTSRKAADSAPADIDEHPENNPYYTAPADAETAVDPVPPAPTGFEIPVDSVSSATVAVYTADAETQIPADFELPVDTGSRDDAVHTYEAARSDAGIPEIEIPSQPEAEASCGSTQPEADVHHRFEQPEADVHENQIWQEAELHQVAAFEEHTEPTCPEDPPQNAAPIDSEYHIRPELASDSWLKDAFIKK